MQTIIITAYKEPETLNKQLQTILTQLTGSTSWEVIVCAPDQETRWVALEYHKNNSNVNVLKDPGKGKPTALNLAFQKARGDVLILTDGDVLIDKKAILEILKPLRQKKIGAVTGQPVAVNQRNHMFGYWARVLVKMAHQTRLKKIKRGEYLDCSGYLYAMRKGIVDKIPENTLADDALISTLVYLQGYQISYAPKAQVYVKYPDNFRDWLKQKKRSTGGYVQIPLLLKKMNKELPPPMRSLKKEAAGIGEIFAEARNLRERWWTILLIFARIILWFLIFWEIKIIKKPFNQVWKRVESTKS